MPNSDEKQVNQLAAMAYGEGSTEDNRDEIFALASVLVRQRNARGYSDIEEFASKDKTFSFVVNDGNERYRKFKTSSEKERERDAGMKIALEAAKNALSGGEDKSNGAYFWDGADIKSRYKIHFKVKNGIKFTDPTHNIYKIKESTEIRIISKTTTTRNKKTGVTTTTSVEVGRYDHVYESTAAHGGTIFWKNSQQYMNVTKAKEYK